MASKFGLEHVERLSRGKRSGVNIGSRSVGHHLRPHERATYERALKKGYLDITEGDRANLWHIWEKACIARSSLFLVLIKDASGEAAIYQDGTLLMTLPMLEAKRCIQELAELDA